MTEQLELFDVTIIGGGPAGMYTAFYSGMRDLKTKVLEYNESLGGKILLYPEKVIWDVGGLVPTRGEQLIKQLEQQAKTFEPVIALNQKITDFHRLEDGNILITSENGDRHLTKTLILAMGHGIPVQRKLEVENADRYEVTNLYYTVQELKTFAGKKSSSLGAAILRWIGQMPLCQLRKVSLLYTAEICLVDMKKTWRI